MSRRAHHETIAAWIKDNPWVAIVSFTVGVAGTIWGFISPFADVREPELTFYVAGKRDLVIDKELVSEAELTVLSPQKEEIRSDVRTVIIQVWNGGRDPLPSTAPGTDGTLIPPRIVSVPPVPILKARVRSVARAESRTSLYFSDQDRRNGVIYVHWQTFGKNDYADLAITYQGPANVSFALEGSFVVQEKVHRSRLPRPG